MDITPLIPDGYSGSFKQLTCSICKHVFYITQDHYHRHPAVRFCHECSLLLREEFEKTPRANTFATPPVIEMPIARASQSTSVAPLSPIPLPQPRTIDRAKMTVEQLLDEAKMLRKTWRYKEALHSYEEALQRDPCCLKALYGRANMLGALNRSQEALAVYEEILCLEPGSAKATSRKGETLTGLRRYDEALATFDAALQLDASSTEASVGKWFVLTRLHRNEEAEQCQTPRTKRADEQQQLTHTCHTAEDYYRRGCVLHTLDRDKEAIRAYEQCLYLDPFYFDAYRNLYLMRFRKDHCESLVAIFHRAVQAFPTCAQLHLYHAEILGQLERYQETLEACHRAIESDSTSSTAYEKKSDSLHHLKRDSEALEAIDQAIALDPDSDIFHRQKAEILASLRRNEDAVAAYDQAISLDPNNEYAYRAKARFLSQLGRDEDALATYDQFIERFPAVFEGYQEKLFLLSGQKRYEDGLQTCETYLQQHPNHAQAYKWKGHLLSCLHRPEEALLCYEEAIRLQPQGEDAYLAKADLLTNLKRYEEAFSTFNQALQFAPANTSIYQKKGELLLALKRYEEALPIWQKAARLEAKKAAHQEKIGDVLSEMGRYDEAIGSYNRAIRLDRSLVHSYSAKASALEKLGQWEEAFNAYQEALAVCEKALQTKPKSFFLRVSRADILKHVQRYDEAMAEYDLAQNAAPHPSMAVYCIFGQSGVEKAKEAHTRLQAAGKEINRETIETEITLIHKERTLAPLRSSVLFQPLCILMQEVHEWSGKPRQLKELLSTRFPDELKIWYRSPSKFVEELQKITPALQEEGITVGIAPQTALVTLTAKTE